MCTMFCLDVLPDVQYQLHPLNHVCVYVCKMSTSKTIVFVTKISVLFLHFDFELCLYYQTQSNIKISVNCTFIYYTFHDIYNELYVFSFGPYREWSISRAITLGLDNRARVSNLFTFYVTSYVWLAFIHILVNLSYMTSQPRHVVHCFQNSNLRRVVAKTNPKM